MKRKSSALLITLIAISLLYINSSVEAKIGIILVPRDYPTIQMAIDAANEGDMIRVGRGEWYGGVINKQVKIYGLKRTIIIDGPAYPHYPGMPDTNEHIGFFIEPEGSGSTVSHFTFRGGPIGDTGNYLAMAIFARAEPYGPANDVTITNNEIVNCVQCITNWGGDNWIIKNNVITGYYITTGHVSGIVIGTQLGHDSSGNEISHNLIEADVPDIHDFPSKGITLRATSNDIATNNRLIFNKIRLKGLDTAGIQILTDVSATPSPEEIEYAKSILYDNEIRFNNLQGCSNPIDMIPQELEEVNTISNNLL